MEKLTIQIELRKADSHDLKVDAKNLRLGQPLWVKSLETGKFDNKPVIIEEETDPHQLAHWLQGGQVFVPASDLDLKNEENELRTD